MGLVPMSPNTRPRALMIPSRRDFLFGITHHMCRAEKHRVPITQRRASSDSGPVQAFPFWLRCIPVSPLCVKERLRPRIQRLILYVDDVDWRVCNPLEPVISDNEIDFDPDGADTREDKLGLEGEDHAFLQNQTMPCRDDRHLVDLQPQTVADKGYLPFPVPHEVLFQASLLRHLVSPRKKLRRVDACPAEARRVFHDLTGNRIRFSEHLLQLPNHEHPRFVGDVPVITAAIVHDDGNAAFYLEKRCTLGGGRGNAYAGNGYVSSRGNAARVAGKD